MATIEHPPPAGKRPRDPSPLGRGFAYVTLDPSPRLRKFRNQQLSQDPAAMTRQAWATVWNAIATALQAAREGRSQTQ
jgi:hypothetical protein